jgi:hypothetical protein
MENTNNWESFWRGWRTKDVQTEDDLYFQVGRTTQQKPMKKELFDMVNKDIIDVLALTENDILVDLCCGNGLCTYEFRDVVQQIIAVDFAPQMIETAKKYKAAPNITYCLDNIFEFLEAFNNNWNCCPTKFLMNGGLPYFTAEELKTILVNIKKISNGNFISFFTIVPNELLKWNFYNTEERKQKYLENVATGNFINDGIGRWWAPSEIEEICASLTLKCIIRNQAPPLSDYRMDIVICCGIYVK